MGDRNAAVKRETGETRISVELGLDGGASSIETPNGFFDHMLSAFARHGGLGLRLRAQGDTHIDLHHTVEDTGIALGEALHEALGDHAGLIRFGHAYAPLDEALTRVVVDLSGRGYLGYRLPGPLEHAWVTRDFPLTLVEDFLQALADRGRFTLHVDVLEGRNPHHVAEATFKALALALRQAIALRDGQAGDGPAEIPSTKGTLTA